MRNECMALCLAVATLCFRTAGAQERPAGGVSDHVQITPAAGGQSATDERKPEKTKGKGKRRVELGEVVVEAKKPLSAASSDEIRARDYELRPHGTTQEILNNVPGLVVAQHQGGGKATQYLVRGFDATTAPTSPCSWTTCP